MNLFVGKRKIAVLDKFNIETQIWKKKAPTFCFFKNFTKNHKNLNCNKL